METERKPVWRDIHGEAAYIPCGNAYCPDGCCAGCETQMQLQVERKKEQGIPEEQMTPAERRYLESEKTNPEQ